MMTYLKENEQNVPNPITHPEDFLTSEEACKLLSRNGIPLSRSGLLQAYGRRKIVQYKLGRSLFWLKSSVENYRDNRKTIPVYYPGLKEG